MTSDVDNLLREDNPTFTKRLGEVSFAKRLGELKQKKADTESRELSEDQDYLRNDPFIFVPVSVPDSVAVDADDSTTDAEEETNALRGTIGGMMNMYDDLGDDIYSDGDDDSVYDGTIRAIRNMPYSHDYVPHVTIESYKAVPHTTEKSVLPVEGGTTLSKVKPTVEGGSTSQLMVSPVKTYQPDTTVGGTVPQISHLSVRRSDPVPTRDQIAVGGTSKTQHISMIRPFNDDESKQGGAKSQASFLAMSTLAFMTVLCSVVPR